MSPSMSSPSRRSRRHGAAAPAGGVCPSSSSSGCSSRSLPRSSPEPGRAPIPWSQDSRTRPSCRRRRTPEVPALAAALAVVAAALHTLFWYLESIAFPREATWRRFGITSQRDADTIRPMAFNQGFYNLFLAAGVVVGLVLIGTGAVEAGRAVVLFACACMVGAGVVLLLSNRALARSAFIQLTPPLLAITAAFVL